MQHEHHTAREEKVAARQRFDQRIFGSDCRFQRLGFETKKKILREILEKVINCKFSDVIDMVHEDSIARGSDKNITCAGKTTRGPLDILNAVKEDRKKRQMKNQSK